MKTMKSKAYCLLRPSRFRKMSLSERTLLLISRSAEKKLRR